MFANRKPILWDAVSAKGSLTSKGKKYVQEIKDVVKAERKKKMITNKKYKTINNTPTSQRKKKKARSELSKTITTREAWGPRCDVVVRKPALLDQLRLSSSILIW